MMYKDGDEGVVQDVETGLELLEKAADQGNADALDVLGRHYYETEEYENRVSHWEKAAAQGQPNAQVGLGICYHDGRGV